MIVLAFGSVVRRRPCSRGIGLAEWLAPSLGELDELEGGALPHAVVPFLVVGISALGVLVAWLTVGRHRVPVERARARLAAGPGRPPRPLRERDQRGAHRPARHLAHPRAGLLRQPRRRRAGQRHGRGAGRQLRPAAPAADRLRPLVRAEHARRLGPGHRRSPGGGVRVNLLLPVLLVFPLVGALVMYPLRGNPDVAKQVAIGTALLQIVLAAVDLVRLLGARRRGRHPLPARVRARVDPGVRHPVRARASTASRW